MSFIVTFLKAYSFTEGGLLLGLSSIFYKDKPLFQRIVPKIKGFNIKSLPVASIGKAKIRILVSLCLYLLVLNHLFRDGYIQRFQAKLKSSPKAH